MTKPHALVAIAKDIPELNATTMESLDPEVSEI
jgi:hypothetical protein